MIRPPFLCTGLSWREHMHRRIAPLRLEANNTRKKETHDLLMPETKQVFVKRKRPLLMLADEKRGQVERRFHVMGKTPASRELHLTVTLRGEGYVDPRDFRAGYASQGARYL
jgi:hypothetical protein